MPEKGEFPWLTTKISHASGRHNIPGNGKFCKKP
jgi:hypothetical protein